MYKRTNDSMTAGITNIPLTKPASIYFIIDLDDIENLNTVYSLCESLKFLPERSDNYHTGKAFFLTPQLESAQLKNIWRNFKSLHPKIKTDWRYLFWEIDSQEEALITEVLEVYRYLNLPVYVHKSLRGYHFLSVKPIDKNTFAWAIQRLRYTNDRYPPITLRIKPNKWIEEEKIFHEGFIISPKHHSDTKQLRDWIVSQNLSKIGEQYQLVWYSLKDAETFENADLQTRTELFNKQIEESI